MGSAFDYDGLGSDETVLFPMWTGDENDPPVVHHSHPDCREQAPHAMSTCGRFQPAEDQ